MSVEQPDVVDIVGVDKKTGHVVLTISDHLDWADTVEHETVLQAKLNRYLAFVESGEILTSYPDSKDKPIAINVVFKFKPDQEGRRFLARAQEVIESAGFSLRHEVFAESCDN